MGITVLGDVIYILKHSKKVQNQRTTERVLKSEAAENASQQAKSDALPPPSRITQKKSVTENESGGRKIKIMPGGQDRSAASLPSSSSSAVASTSSSKLPTAARLGPPKSRKEAKDRLGPPPGKESIFSRLDSSDRSDSADTEKSGSPGILRKHTRDHDEYDSRDGDDVMENLKRRVQLKRSAEKRVSFDNDRDRDRDRDEPNVKRKKFVMVKTFKDGSTTKQVIEEDDPILHKMPIYKREMTRMTSAPAIVSNAGGDSRRNVIKTVKTSRDPAPVRTRITFDKTSLTPPERKRISPPRSSSKTTSSSRFSADREPQRSSVKSRLSLDSPSASRYTRKSPGLSR